MIPLHINSLFWGAGSIYGWGKREPGLGIKKKVVLSALKLDQEFRITISNDPVKYKIHPQKVLEIGKPKWVKFNTLLLIIPKKALEIYIPKSKKESRVISREILREDNIRETVLEHNI